MRIVAMDELSRKVMFHELISSSLVHRREISIVCLCLVVLSLGGCGDWYLRGTRPSAVAIESAHVSAATAPRLRRALIRELRYSGVAVGSQAGSQAIIHLVDESYDRRVLSVDPDNGKVREIELGLEVNFSVRSKDGKLLVPSEKLTWVQDYVFDENSLLGTTERASIIERELAEDAAQTILVRLETIKVGSP